MLRSTAGMRSMRQCSAWPEMSASIFAGLFDRAAHELLQKLVTLRLHRVLFRVQASIERFDRFLDRLLAHIPLEENL